MVAVLLRDQQVRKLGVRLTGGEVEFEVEGLDSKSIRKLFLRGHLTFGVALSFWEQTFVANVMHSKGLWLLLLASLMNEYRFHLGQLFFGRFRTVHTLSHSGHNSPI